MIIFIYLKKIKFSDNSKPLWYNGKLQLIRSKKIKNFYYRQIKERNVNSIFIVGLYF